MSWMLIVYGAFLCYLLVDKKRIVNISSFRNAWVVFAAIPFSDAFLTLFRAGNIDSLISVEVWADGFAWLFFGISFLALFNALTGESEAIKMPSTEESGATPEPYVPDNLM